MKIVKSLPFRLLMGIAVPLIIIGFIAPSITKLGNNATRLLLVAILTAYMSSVLAACMSAVAGFTLIPHIAINSAAEEIRELPVERSWPRWVLSPAFSASMRTARP